jgi:hypothetical protein
MPHHLEPVEDLDDPVEDLPEHEPGETDPTGGGRRRRPGWWRWVAIVAVIALVVATPFAYALSVALR